MTAIKSVVCTSCHLEQFQGNSSIPRLAGQERDYLAKTMTDFRTGTRANNPGMSDLIHTVTPDQLIAIAAYLAGFRAETKLYDLRRWRIAAARRRRSARPQSGTSGSRRMGGARVGTRMSPSAHKPSVAWRHACTKEFDKEHEIVITMLT